MFEYVYYGIFAIVIGFICISYSILLFFTVWSLPIYAIVLYFVWILITVLLIVYSKHKSWYEIICLPASITIPFTVIYLIGCFRVGLVEEVESFITFALAPFLALPTLYWIGNKFRKNIQSKNKEYINANKIKLNELISKKILEKTEAQKIIQQYDFNRRRIHHLFKLINLLDDNEHIKEEIQENLINNEDILFKKYVQSISCRIPLCEKEKFPKTLSDIESYKKQINADVESLKCKLNYINEIISKKQINMVYEELKIKER